MNARRKPLWIGILLLTLGVALLLFMNYAKFSSTLEGRERARHTMLATHLAKTLEARLALGLELEDTAALQSAFRLELRHDARLRAIVALDAGGGRRIVVQDEAGDARAGAPELWEEARRAAASGQPMPERGQAGSLALPLQNAFGVRAGWLVLEYDLAATQKQAHQAFNRLWPGALLALAAAIVLLAILAPRMARGVQDAGEENDERRREQGRRAMRRLGVLLSLLLMLVQGAIAWRAYGLFSEVGAEDAPRLAATFAHTLTPGLERALALGIPIEDLRGVNDWLQPAFANGAEFARVAIENKDGRTLFLADNPAAGEDRAATADSVFRFALTVRGETAGQLVVSLDPNPLAERTRQLGIEFATLLAIGVLLSMEVLHGMLARNRHAHSQHEQADAGRMLARLRLPLFLYFTGSELARAFLPMWAKQLAQQPLPRLWEGTPLEQWFAPFALLPESLRSTLPISLFLLTIALVSPFAGRQSARHGPLRLLNTGLLLALGGHVAALLADSLLTLCVARVLTGASSGFITVAAFDYIGRSGARARGMAVYLAAYVAAGICGAGLGSLLVDRAGTSGVFALGIAFTLLAALSLLHMPRQTHAAHAPTPLSGALLHLLRQPRFLGLLVLVGLPMQLLQQGLLFYWAPLALSAQGESTSFIGLTMMAYFFLVLLLNAPAARWADRSGRHAAIVLAGLALAGAMALLAALADTPAAIALAVAAIGVIWAAGFPAQGALVLRLGEHDLAGVAPTVAIGVYRMVERIGAMLAAPAIALMVAGAGYAGTSGLIGALLLLCALLQGWLLLRDRKSVATVADDGV
ncbi:MFS transporter [Herbaspirillum robiniae]|uniref:Major facilitator superfamily (MFS) profile domain-containing protein n=1 Tax=Herbaspirillum robiniae TaxID=2014887 RepID=A0A246WK57_9BURK|nr:MFS transporter [Herbaspirillum robiniae]OWY26614.1 hypothetical protein CEJ42_22910 [Herbaspirillum robiniae]